MKCPECKIEMVVVAVIPGQGVRLKIEQCPKCGHEESYT